MPEKIDTHFLLPLKLAARVPTLLSLSPIFRPSPSGSVSSIAFRLNQRMQEWVQMAMIGKWAADSAMDILNRRRRRRRWADPLN